MLFVLHPQGLFDGQLQSAAERLARSKNGLFDALENVAYVLYTRHTGKAPVRRE